SDQRRRGGRNSCFHVERTTSEDPAVFLDRFERRWHPFHTDCVEVSIQQKARSRTCATNTSYDIEAVGANFFQAGDNPLGLQYRQQILGDPTLPGTSSNQGWIHRLDLDERFENAQAALKGSYRYHDIRLDQIIHEERWRSLK